MSTFDLFTPKISTFNMWLINNLLQNYLHFLGAETCSQEKEKEKIYIDFEKPHKYVT